MSRSITHFEVLGVDSAATDAQIRQAFRRKALELHPDRSAHHKMSVEEARRRFVQARAAYEILIDLQLRRQYESQLKGHPHPEPQPYHSSADDNPRSTNSVHYERPSASAVARLRPRPMSWSAFREELDAALHAAEHGPQTVDVDAHGYPEHLETEELRTWAALDDDGVILHVVLGRQVLGCVCWSASLPAELDASLADEQHPDVLRLHWGSELRATGVRRRLRGGGTVVEYFLYPLGGAEPELVARQSVLPDQLPVLLDPAGVVTHTIVQSQTALGVGECNLFDVHGRFVEFKCSRAWLPPPWAWFFAPRDSRYAAGGWYVQSNKDGRYSRRTRRPATASDVSGLRSQNAGLNAAVTLLLCAFQSLDRLRRS